MSIEQPSSSSSSSSPASSPPAGEPNQQGTLSLLVQMMQELRLQRQSFEAANRAAHEERRKEHRWKILFQGLVFVLPVLMGIFLFTMKTLAAGGSLSPFGDKVAVIRVEGKIAADETASADNIIPLLERAFEADSVKAIALSIDSPGGAPVETERIYTQLRELKKKHPKPVVAFVENMGASAAYLLAIHADKIVAAKYSVVGSIGAIMDTWQVDRAMERVDVSQRVFASGRLKSFLNPFTPPSAETDAKALALVTHVGTLFHDEVRMRRGTRLASTIDITTGEVWSGDEALKLGLVDEIGTLDQYANDHWNLPTLDVGPVRRSSTFLSNSIRDAISGMVQSLLSQAPQLR